MNDVIIIIIIIYYYYHYMTTYFYEHICKARHCLVDENMHNKTTTLYT